MRTAAPKSNHESGSRAIADQAARKQGGNEGNINFVDNRQEAVQLRKLREMADSSLQAKESTQIQGMMDHSPPVVAQRQRLEQLFGAPVPRENTTGSPDALKSGIESLSGISLDAVDVHYNSAKPAALGPLA